MGGIAPAAGGTFPTKSIDLTHHALAHQLRRVVGTGHFPHKLVAQHALEPQVPAHNLQIGVADAGQPGTDQGLARRWGGVGGIPPVFKLFIKI